MIKFKNVSRAYSSTPVLDDISFEIQDGEFVSIVGRSGAGKSTLVKLLLGIETPSSGEIIIDGCNVSQLKPIELSQLRQKIGVVYQDYRLLQNKTVYENVAYVMQVQGKNEERIKEEAEKVLEITGLSDKADNFPDQLSGGEQQRLAVARAIINQPDVVIADEPTGNLDPYNTYEVISLLVKINTLGKTVILASHDKEVINKLKKRVITLDGGKVIRDDKIGQFIL
ncbi:cell division ATP-binding protein FtsE [Patescibacteria group bacterium]|nr:cell division ATP-binding protein FtsE [Patescibacteria group bacterium]